MRPISYISLAFSSTQSFSLVFFNIYIFFSCHFYCCCFFFIYFFILILLLWCWLYSTSVFFFLVSSFCFISYHISFPFIYVIAIYICHLDFPCLDLYLHFPTAEVSLHLPGSRLESGIIAFMPRPTFRPISGKEELATHLDSRLFLFDESP